MPNQTHDQRRRIILNPNGLPMSYGCVRSNNRYRYLLILLHTFMSLCPKMPIHYIGSNALINIIIKPSLISD